MKVYVIDGWFGDVNWIESIYADETKAEDRVDALWVERRSKVLPEDHYCQGLCKFGTSEHEVVE